MDKTSLQQNAFDDLKYKHRVILRWATGVGKSNMTIQLVNNAASHFYKPTALLVVAERSHIKNWEEEFSKWGLSANIDIKIICYASLKKVKDEYFGILILDEAHHCFTEKRMAILDTIRADYVYMLSATLSMKRVWDIESIFGKFDISTVSLKDAIGNDILPEPRVNVIEMHLDNTTPNQEIVIGNADNPPVIKWEERGKYIYKNKPCIIKCTERQKYSFFTEKMEYWKQRYEISHNQFHHNTWVNYGSKRKRFLGELKTEYVRKLIAKLYRKRFICFCASVAQAQSLDKNNTISSKRASKANQAIINSFNAKKLHRLYAIGMATEGLNLNAIEVGIIVQLDGKERLFVQKFGRSLRAEDPVTYIFYYKDTQDEKYLTNALENIEEKYIKHISIS